jgi:cytochrome c553
MLRELFVKNFAWAASLALLFVFVLGAQAPPNRPNWAFLVPDKEQPPSEPNTGPIHVPGSAKTYTPAQIDDLANPPNWFPDEYGAPPKIVTGGLGPSMLACGACHLMSGRGHPESADVSGLSVEYIVRQMADFKNGTRIDPARMNAIAKVTSDEDSRKAAEWFASLKPSVWVKVVETTMAPKSFVSTRGRMRLPMPGGGMEPLGNRIIELPEDAARAESRDPKSPFIAYVPPGSIKKGEELVMTGGSGKTINCTICHGDGLKGLGDVPRLAGQHPLYIARQLYGFQTGQYSGTSAALMKKVVANLTADDMLALSAYAASLAP